MAWRRGGAGGEGMASDGAARLVARDGEGSEGLGLDSCVVPLIMG